MKQITHLDKKDFGKKVNAEGYQITYKGQNIGGAGILGKFKGRGRSAQIKDYSESAERDIISLINGNGQPYLYEAIDRINSEPTTPPQPKEPLIEGENELVKYKNMPQWNNINYRSFRKWAQACFDAGKKEMNIGFARWIRDEDYRESKRDVDKWYQYPFTEDTEFYTTDQLYTRYLNQ